MSTFFTFLSNSTQVAIRVVIGIGIFLFGLIGYVFFSDSVRYTTTEYYDLLLREWVIAAKPAFFSLVPAFSLALFKIFPDTSRKLLALTALVSGIVLTIPAFMYIIYLWHPLVQTISGLPISEVKYHRHTGTFPDGLDSMSIDFVIPKQTFHNVEYILKARIAENNGATIKDFLEHPINEYDYLFSFHERTPGKIEATLDRNKW